MPGASGGTTKANPIRDNIGNLPYSPDRRYRRAGDHPLVGDLCGEGNDFAGVGEAFVVLCACA